MLGVAATYAGTLSTIPVMKAVSAKLATGISNLGGGGGGAAGGGFNAVAPAHAAAQARFPGISVQNASFLGGIG